MKKDGKQVPKKSPTEGKQQEAKKSPTKSVRKKKKTPAPAKTTTLWTREKRDRAQREGRLIGTRKSSRNRG